MCCDDGNDESLFFKTTFLDWMRIYSSDRHISYEIPEGSGCKIKALVRFLLRDEQYTQQLEFK